LLTGLSGARRRGGYVKPVWRFLYTHALATPVDDLVILAPKHITEIYLDLLASCGVPRADHRGLEMWPGEAAERSAAALWEQAGLSGKSPIIGILAGVTFPSKLWTVEGYARLCDLLTAAGMTPVMFGGPGDVERAAAISALTATPPISFVGQASLLELAALVRGCAVVVAGDTGPMHIAASQHVPIVALYSRTLRQVYAPLRTEHVLLAGDVPCLECNKHDCDDMRCMTTLPAERVFDAVQAMLATITSSGARR
jgi:heptosyltransferase-2